MGRPRGRRLPRPRGSWVLGLSLVAVALLAASVALTVLKPSSDETDVAPGPATSAGRIAPSSRTIAVSTDASIPVEVPALAGLSLKEARIVLEAAGLRAAGGKKASSSAIVATQSPSPGVLKPAGSLVSLFLESGPGDKRTYVVCLDPGHQQHADNTPEAVRPGSRAAKPRMSAGTTGIRTGLQEYEITLQIAMNVKRRLEAGGIKVVMTRTTNDVNVSNAERAKIANKADADLFVRIHANGSPESKDAGIVTLYPAKRKSTTRISAPSKRAARLVQAATVAKTEAIDLGIDGRDDLAGFNFAKMPSVLVECGFLSNPIEDRLLASPHYHDSLSEGITQGVLDYLRLGE